MKVFNLLLYLIKLSVLFAQLLKWDAIYSSALMEDGKSILSDDGFPAFMKMASEQFPQLDGFKINSWSDLASLIISISINDTEYEWVYPMTQLLRYGDFGRQVVLDIKAEPFMTGQDDQIIKLDIINNLKNHYNITNVFDPRALYFLESQTEVNPVPLMGLSDLMTVKNFALIFGDGFITEELDENGLALEGGDPRITGNILIELLHQTVISVKELEIDTIGDMSELTKLAETVKKSLEFAQIMEGCRNFARPFELFEDIMISKLREQRPGEEYMLLTGFTEHAMIVTFKRNGNHYDVSVYNSGSGIEYHESTTDARLEKFSPLRRFASVPLAFLKSSGFIRRLAEIGGGNHAMDIDGDPGNRKAFNASDMYDNVVSTLKAFEVPLGGIGPNLKKLVKSQRSGTCSWLGFIVFMASKLDNFRFIKLIMSKVALVTALAKPEFKPDASAVSRRLVKFALENYARSVEKFGKYDDIDNSFDLDIFGDDQFWELYKDYSGVWPYHRKREFNVDPGVPDRQNAGTQYSMLLGISSELENLFNQVTTAPQNYPILLIPGYEQLREDLFGNCSTAEDFLRHLNSIVPVVMDSWAGTPNQDKLAFIVSTILYRWPSPDISGKSIYVEVFSETPAGQTAQQTLFKIVKSIIGLVTNELTWFPHIQIAIAKILAIYHSLLVKIHKPFERVDVTHETTFDAFDANQSLMLNGSIHAQTSSLKRIIAGTFNIVCFEVYTRTMVTGGENILENYLKDIMTKNSFIPSGTLSDSVLKVFSKRLHDAFPTALYYWRDMTFLVNMLHGIMDPVSQKITIKIPFLQSIDLHDPLSSCDMEDTNPSTMCFGSCFVKTLETWTDEYVPRKPLDSTAANEDFHSINMQFRRYFKVHGQTQLKSNVSDNFYFITRGGEENTNLIVGEKTNFRDFLGMFDECKADIKFNELLEFGSRISAKIAGLALQLLEKHLNIDIQALETGSLSNSRESIIVSERIAGMIIIALYIFSMSSAVEDSALEKLRERIFTFSMKEERDEVSVFLQLGFLASVQPELRHSLAKDESARIILLNQKFCKISQLLPEHYRFETLKFNVRMNVAQAVTGYFGACSAAGEQIDYKQLSLLPPVAEQNTFPWVLAEKGTFIDFVSGIQYAIDGVVSTVLDEASKALLKEAKLDHMLDKMAEVHTSIRLGVPLISFTPKPGTSWQPNGPLSSGQIQRVEVLKHFNVHHRALLHLGVYAYRIAKGQIPEMDMFPIPATSDPESPYEVWCVPQRNLIWFLSDSGIVFIKNGMTNLLKESKKNMARLLSADPRVIPLCGPNGVECFMDGTSPLMLFKNLIDFSGQRLMFTLRSSKWIYQNNEQYWISSNQEFEPSAYIKYSLVIESKEHSKVIIPVQHVKVSKSNLQGQDSNLMQQKTCILVSLSPDRSIQPESRLEYLVLAYNYLIARNYILAFEALTRIHHMEAFGEGALRLFGWIIHSDEDNLDGSPESCAVRAFAAFLVYSNRNLFSFAYKNEDELKRPSPYSKGSEWRTYWALILSTPNTPIRKIVMSYYTRKSKISSTLRHDPASRRRLQTKYEQQKWLQFLFIDILGKPKRSDVLAVPRTFAKPIRWENLYGAAYEFLKLANECLEDPKRPLTLDLDKISWVYPESIVTNFKKILMELVFREIPPFQRDRLRSFFASLRSTQFAFYAKPLETALTDAKRKEFWKTLILAGKIELFAGQISPDIEHIQQMTGYRTAPMDLEASEIEDNDTAMDEECNITTHLYPDSDGKDEIDIAKIKATKDATTLADVIHRLEKFKTALEGKIRDICGKRSETIRKQIAKGLFLLSNTDLLRLYSQESCDLYKQLLPDIDDQANYQILHDHITTWVLASTNLNDLKRTLNALSSGDEHEIEKEMRRVRIASTQDNIALAYESYINSRLEKQQIEDTRALLRLEKGSAKLLQRIMSSGKTFVYGTCLAVGRADGNHLSILVVPKSLFSSEATNIIMRTMGAFGYDGFSFQISRDKSDAKTLEWIYHSLLNAIEKRKYLIIPPETLLVLQNMFFEESMNQNVTPKYTALMKILSLLRRKGVVVFDEVDTIFSPKHELNSPISSSLQTEGSLDMLALQAMFIAEIFSCFLEPEVLEIQDIRKNILITEVTYKKVVPIVAKILAQRMVSDKYFMAIMSNPRMPRQLFEGFNQEDIFGFLSVGSDQFAKYSNVFSMLSGLRLSLLSLCRLAIQDWVYMAWNGNVNENYGVSPNPSITYAIPYMGANNPKADSEFLFRWYSYTRTFRMYLVFGLNRNTLAKSLTWIQRKCNDDEDCDRWKGLLEKLFDLKPQDLEDLSPIHVNNLRMKMLTRTEIPEYKQYLFEWIVSEVIPSIKFYQQQISSNTHDIPMMVKSYCAYSGTVPSLQQLPPMLRKWGDFKDDIITSIRQAVLKNSRKTVMHLPVGITSANFFTDLQIFESPVEVEQFSAIIDVGAFFKDEPNQLVARSILLKLPAKNAVLFYDRFNKVVYSTLKEPSKPLGSTTKAGLARQGIPEEGRVTYYDQQHTTGSDVYHHPNALAIIIIGSKTTIRDFYQAVMRMRSLLQDQKLIIMAPTDTIKAIQNFTGSIDETVSVEDCLRFMDHNQASESKKLNLMSLSKIIRAQYKNAVYQELLDNPGKACLVVGLWIKESEMNLETMAMPRIEKNTFEIIKGYNQHLMKISQNYLSQKSFDEVVKKTERVIAKAEEEAEMYEPVISAAVGQNSIYEGEQIVENQVEAAKLVELEVESTPAKPAILQRLSSPFLLDFNVDYFPEIQDYSIHSRSLEPGCINLDKFFTANPAFNLLGGVFDKRIYVSKGFTDVFFGSRRNLVLNVIAFYFAPRDQDDCEKMNINYLAQNLEMNFVIVSSLEAKIFYNENDSKRNFAFGCNGFLLSPNMPMHNKLREHIPAEFLDSQEYSKIMSQILIFGGHYNVLSQKEWLPHFEEWLGNGDQRLMRSALFREIILDKEEWKRAVKTKLPIVNACSTYAFDHAALVESTPFAMLNFLKRNKQGILDLFNKLDVTDPARILIAETEAVYNLDDNATILYAVLPEILERGVDLKQIQRLALGFSIKPEKLLEIFSVYILRADLSSFNTLERIAQISECLGIMTNTPEFSRKIDGVLEKFVSGKTFKSHPLAIRTLFPLWTVHYKYTSAFGHLLNTVHPKDREVIEELYSKIKPTQAVLDSYFENFMMKEYSNNFDPTHVLKKIKNQMNFIAVPPGLITHLMTWCRHWQDIAEFYTTHLREFGTENDMVMGVDIENMAVEDARKFVIETFEKPRENLPLIIDIPEPQSKKQKNHHETR